MSYIIKKATLKDLDTIRLLFEGAIQFQKANKYIGWKSYDEKFIITDINNGLLYKLEKDLVIIGIFCICFSDPIIWREKEKGNAVYLHRVVLNQKYKGEKIFSRILNWTKNLAEQQRLNYIRIDTWAENEKIISYYKNYGFLFIENYTTPGTDDLPAQHRNLNVALLELDLQTGHTFSQPDKVNISHAFEEINKYWNQKTIGECNGQLIKLAKGIGEINWHQHDDQDELFILYKGHLTIQLRNKNIDLLPGEMFIVPKGTEHCPVSHGLSEFLIMGLNITSNAAGGRPEKWN